MELTEKIQRDIDGIADCGYCNYVETFKTLIEAKKAIIELRKQVKNNVGFGGVSQQRELLIAFQNFLILDGQLDLEPDDVEKYAKIFLSN